ncbi:MAG: hypothetical protein PHP51_02565 [Desulfotomaculaceae bacterium]|nr:hypothetical protein [Desulfotomaculaceae bacterium]MDD4766167.1 hypothetical protein [Desulfotomaculaceae bacterium]
MLRLQTKSAVLSPPGIRAGGRRRDSDVYGAQQRPLLKIEAPVGWLFSRRSLCG